MNQESKSRTTIVVSQIVEKIQLILGIIITCFFGIGFLGCISSGNIDAATIILAIVFLSLGVWLIILSRKRNKLIKNFKTYVSILSVDPTGSLENLASSLGTSQDIVKNNLKLMCDKKYFVNAYLDTERNCIVFPSKSEQINSTAQQSSKVSESNKEYNTVKCKNCGADNKIPKGIIGECEFCGSQIK
ncbi:hypothetical protein [Clostridium weizhouense]|uniref:Uncharacterized protein n=1 Tax=Clostridium weizhouense TaxID=2859781 RepID=A0ABS7ART2_9CLOT|nr:hypothetical protein [Clostridium weizhouense]MBW6411380.1 hypothetical protein [Clostridium weizhouense]